jgi:hypothetical protein
MRIERKHGAIAALVLVALVVAGVSASLSRGDANGGGAVGLRAKLAGRAQQTRTGIFVATLRGTSLRWSLAYKSAGKSRLSARVRAGGARPAKLCGSCSALARGRAHVTRSLARALTHRRAVVELRSAGATGPALSGRVIVQQVPVLVITEPKPGASVTLPTDVSYSVSSVEINQPSGFQLEVFVANSDGTHVTLPLAEPSGSVTLPDVKNAYLVGHHDLTFRLLNADGVPFPNPEATVVVPRLTIQGKKGG